MLPAPIHMSMNGRRNLIPPGKQNPTNIHPEFGHQITAVEACESSA